MNITNTQVIEGVFTSSTSVSKRTSTYNLKPTTERGKLNLLKRLIKNNCCIKEETGGTYSLIEAKVFQEEERFHTFKHVNNEGFYVIEAE